MNTKMSSPRDKIISRVTDNITHILIVYSIIHFSGICCPPTGSQCTQYTPNRFWYMCCDCVCLRMGSVFLCLFFPTILLSLIFTVEMTLLYSVSLSQTKKLSPLNVILSIAFVTDSFMYSVRRQRQCWCCCWICCHCRWRFIFRVHSLRLYIYIYMKTKKEITT